jgi:hypothetical protein
MHILIYLTSAISVDKCIIYQCIEQLNPSRQLRLTGSMLNKSSQKGRFSRKPLLARG